MARRTAPRPEAPTSRTLAADERMHPTHTHTWTVCRMINRHTPMPGGTIARCDTLADARVILRRLKSTVGVMLLKTDGTGRVLDSRDH